MMINIVSRVALITAWIIGVFFLVLTLIIFFGGGGPDAPRFMGFVTLFLGIFNFIVLFAINKMLLLLLDIKENTKYTKKLTTEGAK
ncbi:MAG: hypothetical protein ABH952_02970 [Candidatus Omnitrophota bacterium]